jgi:hypothetical protein
MFELLKKRFLWLWCFKTFYKLSEDAKLLSCALLVEYYGLSEVMLTRVEHLKPGFNKKDRVGLLIIFEAAGVAPLLLICLMNMLHRFKPIDFSNAKPRSF